MAKEDKFADEMLTDDELDQISGGTLQESADDSHYLNDLLYGKPGQCDQYGKTSVYFKERVRDEIKTAWSSLGITCSMISFHGNKYEYAGQEISRRRAYEIAWERAGRNPSDLPPSWGT